MLGIVLFVLFVGIPIVEISLFLVVGGEIGTIPTIAIVILTALLGSVMIRIQGFGILARFQETLRQGGLPVREMFDGVCVLVAGAFLLTPGFFTDMAGFLLLLPVTRDVLLAWLGPKLVAAFRGSGADHGIIDAEFTIVTPTDDDDDDRRNGGGKRSR